MIISLINSFQYFVRPFVIPLSIACLAVIIFCVIYGFKDIKKQFKDIDKKTWVILTLIVLFGFVIRMFFIPHAHVINDEFYYMQDATKLLQLDFAESRLSNPIISTIYATSFLLFGINNYVAINTATLFGVASIFLIFLFAYILFKNKTIALFAALILCLQPTHLIQSGNAYDKVMILFFVLLALLAFFMYFKTTKFGMHLLALSSLVAAISVRREYMLLLVLVPFMYALFKGGLKLQFKNYKFWAALAIFVLFFSSSLYMVFWETAVMFPAEFGGGPSYKIQLQNFNQNFQRLGAYLPIHNFGPLQAISCFFFIFILITLINFKKETKKFLFLISLFLLFFVFYLFYNFIAPMESYMLVPSACLIILVSYGICASLKITNLLKNNGIKVAIRAVMILVIISVISCYSFYAASNYRYQKDDLLETKIPELAKKQIPKNCYVLAVNPERLTTTGLEVMGIRDLNRDDINNLINEKGCVLFFEGIYCFEMDGSLTAECKSIHEDYNLASYVEYGDEKKFTFYNLSMRT